MPSWNWSAFCGHRDTFYPWHAKDFGHCFEQIVVLTSAHIIFAVTSIYHFGRGTSSIHGTIVNVHWPWYLVARLLITVGLGISSLLQIVFMVSVEGILPSIADGAVCGVTFFTWTLHSLYVWNLRFLLYCTLRGPFSLLVSFLIVSISVAVHVHTVIVRHVSNSPYQSVSEEYTTYANALLCVFYTLTLIPNTRRIFSSIHSLHVNVGEEDIEHLLSSEARSHTAPSDSSDDFLLAEKGVNCFSWVSFHWAQKLMSKGYKNKILYIKDMFYLPNRLNTLMIEAKTRKIFKKYEENSSARSGSTHISNGNLIDDRIEACTESNQMSQPENVTSKSVTLWRVLNAAFAVEYYSLGILKFTADCLGFAGPILLNYLVTFVEDKSDGSYRGYFYVLGLFLSTFLSMICSTQFDYNVQVVAYKMRCALITTIYKKCLSLNSVEKAHFTTGEIVNFMSTDTDRILNFCQSFHAFWSLPFQIGVSLFLLYQQVGLAFLAGLGFALLLIPINRLIAMKIGKLSKEMMHFKDERVKLMTEILAGVRVIKFYSWENHFMSQINKFRKGELHCLKGRKYLDALCVFFWATTPVLISIFTFSTYVLIGYRLTAAKIFTSLSLFLMLIGPLNAFPWVINGLVEAWVSMKRVQVFVNLKDSNPLDYYMPLNISEENVINLENASFSWKHTDSDSTPSEREGENGTKASHEVTMLGESSSQSGATETQGLMNISLSVKKGHLIGIIGKVGSGKSSLLSAIIGDMKKLKGEIFVRDFERGFALASQEAWIQHGSIKENIIFGRPFDDERYRQVLEVCALSDDLKTMAAGDETEIGENGVNLSGGQKARVSLARAVYQDKELYLLDDPLSAVDTHVAEHIFSHGISRFLHNKTRLLCTHHVKFLNRADLVIVMEKGRILKSGPPSSILDMDIDAVPMSEDPDVEYEPGMEDNQLVDQLTEEETREQGVVKASVYKAYWKAIGTCLSSSILIALFLMQASRNSSDWWLSYWVSHSVENPPSGSNITTYMVLWTKSSLPWTNLTFGSDNLEFYLGIYGGLAGANSIFTLLRAFLFAYGGICAAKTVHEKLLTTILKAPISFFDSTPLGRIVNRFSSDLYAVDDSLPFILNIFLAQAYGIAGTLVITCYGLPWFAICLIPLGAIYYKIQNYYRFTSRELKRLSSVTLSPVYAHFTETITGLAVIRAMRHSQRFCQENMDRLDINQRAQYATQLAARWLDFRLRMLGVGMVTILSLIAVLQHQYTSVNAGLVGLAISYSLSVTSLLGGVVMAFTETEKEMVSMERCQDYISNIPEESWEGLLMALPDWPQNGMVEFQSVFVQYRASGNYALNDVSLKIHGGEKVGIVGRTGAGKSSLFSAIFRLVEVSSGMITVDGVNLAHLDLSDVRSRFAIIPQDPFLFSGSIKANLDPTDCHSDMELWDVLERCHLRDYVEQLGGLKTVLTHGGKEFSVGQKQLICLGRAMLTKAKILCIDEATASVDMDTDSMIQNTIQQEFFSSTVLTIAHRINTVMDSQRVLVMKDGTVAEFDSPHVLLRDSNSMFYHFVHGKSSGISS